MTIRKSIRVECPPAKAFRVFCGEISHWWPRGFTEGSRMSLETRVGGRLYETRSDGSQYDIGRVTAYQPPARVAFTWRAPSWTLETSVEIRFFDDATGTRVELEHSGWEVDPRISAARKNYEEGWHAMMEHYRAHADAAV